MGTHVRIKDFKIKKIKNPKKIKASVLQSSAFFMVQLSHLYTTTGKTVALTVWTFEGKVISLLSKMLSSSVITFLLLSFNFMASVILECSDFGAQENKV